MTVTAALLWSVAFWVALILLAGWLT